MASELVNGVIIVVALRHVLRLQALAAPIAKMAVLAVVTVLPLWALRMALHDYSIAVGLPLGIVLLTLGLRVARVLGPAEREALSRMPLIGRYARLL